VRHAGLPGWRSHARHRGADYDAFIETYVRSGADVAKALALGATAVGIGRPYVYALAVGGTDAVVSQLSALLAELDLTMAIDGYPTVDALRGDGAIRWVT
jgi:isopentenyl diphosphate isomerase/L-lactate dehydrogenase-like FMN-dependent dehydrogenase